MKMKDERYVVCDEASRERNIYFRKATKKKESGKKRKRVRGRERKRTEQREEEFEGRKENG